MSESFETILDRMKARVDDKYDTSEGSMLHDALASVALELANQEQEREDWQNEVFADTASRDNLLRRGAEKGIYPTSATCAVLKAETVPVILEIPIGSRYTLGEFNYTLTAKVSDGVYEVTCETPGADGGRTLGEMIPIDYVPGLESITATEVLIPGEDDEETEAFRQKYYNSFDSKAFGGNIEDYRTKANALAGVGAAKVTPVWDGGGTVKVTILNSDYDKASPTLVAFVQNEIDPTQDGTGVGLAPIDHVVTIDTATETTCNISFVLALQDGVTFESIKSQIVEALEAYMLTLRQAWESAETTVVRISQIEYRVLSVPGVQDISDTAINGVEDNLTIGMYGIPILGSVTNG